MLIKILIMAFVLFTVNCTPSVRYTRDTYTHGGHQTHSQSRGRQPQKQAARPAAQRPRRATPDQLAKVADSYVGTPYRYGGMSRDGTDCSGFVAMVFRDVYNKTDLPRSSADMWKVGVPVALSAARPGDLVFFKGGSFGAIDHVGIYMGEKRFIHASSSRGVVYNNLDETYYSRRFAGLRRVL